MTAVLPEAGVRPLPSPRPPSGRPPLHAVPPGRESRASRRASRRARARLLAVAVLVSTAAALLGLVASHVALTQGQFELQNLRERAAVEQARYERLRLHVAELESPARIVAAAQERLGMVPPPGVVYLSPAGPASGLASRAQAEHEAATEDWSEVKRQLASRP